MKKVYICSPCRGDYENNIQRAKEYSRAAAMRGCIPIAPHIYLTQFLDDTVPAERELGLSFGRDLVLLCDELWAFGLDHPSAGMAGEIETAKAAGIPVVNGFKAISEIPGTDTDTPAAAEDPDDIGDVTLHLPAPAGRRLAASHLPHLRRRVLGERRPPAGDGSRARAAGRVYGLRPERGAGMMQRDDVLDTAKKCVSSDREAQYGDPASNFALVADLWTAYRGRPGETYTPLDVAMMLALLKVARIRTGATKDDNFVDLCGYSAIAGEIAGIMDGSAGGKRLAP